MLNQSWEFQNALKTSPCWSGTLGKSVPYHAKSGSVEPILWKACQWKPRVPREDNIEGSTCSPPVRAIHPWTIQWFIDQEAPHPAPYQLCCCRPCGSEWMNHVLIEATFQPWWLVVLVHPSWSKHWMKMFLFTYTNRASDGSFVAMLH